MGWGPCKTPEPENQTVKEIERRLAELEKEKSLRETQERQRKEAEERQEQERKKKEEEEEERRRRDEEERKGREEQDKARKKEEELQMQAKLQKLEQEATEAKQREEQFRKDLAEQQRRTDEMARIQRQLEEQTNERKRREQEANEAKRREEESRREAEEKLRRADEEMAAYQHQLEQQADEVKRRAEEEMAAYQRQLELEQQADEAKRREKEAIEARDRFRREVEEQQRQADKEMAVYQRQLEEEAAEARRRETEAIEARDRLSREAEEQQRQADEQHAVLMQNALQAQRKLSKGIQPLLWPTQEEVDAAKARVQYDPERMHFAVCGPSGSGKSSLINALRGLKKGEQGAANVGVVETTREVTRYTDPRTEMPYSRFVWCDVPGAGTFNIPAWQYFNQQGLFIFDFIILVYNDRFTQIDADILANCRRFKIPALIVRSKANQQIGNLMEDDNCEYEEARVKYVKSTQDDLWKNLQEYGLWKSGEGEPPSCYIVSRECVYDYILGIDEDRTTKTKISQDEKKGGLLTDKYIHEEQLIHDLLQTAYERRYIPSNRTAAIVSSVALAAFKTSSAASKTITSAASKTITSATSKFDGLLSRFPN
ncbi:hypothetical protein K440DRAFT_663833 [Wilcoxina mikolae CBS 423.85]|nr:hypothetical protein K440DRAFT_663833 [Wilcoxina mikolae CBS 423.85]